MAVKKFTVRSAVAADSEGISEVHMVSIRTLGAKAYDPEIIDDWGAPRSGELYRRSMEKGTLFFVAVEHEPDKDERILGFSSYVFVGDKHRTAVYVRGDAGRSGVGTALFTAAESAARHHGAEKIDVDASVGAVGFYKANGFEELGIGEHELKSGRKMACVFMRKYL